MMNKNKIQSETAVSTFSNDPSPSKSPTGEVAKALLDDAVHNLANDLGLDSNPFYHGNTSNQIAQDFLTFDRKQNVLNADVTCNGIHGLNDDGTPCLRKPMRKRKRISKPTFSISGVSNPPYTEKQVNPDFQLGNSEANKYRTESMAHPSQSICLTNFFQPQNSVHDEGRRSTSLDPSSASSIPDCNKRYRAKDPFSTSVQGRQPEFDSNQQVMFEASSRKKLSQARDVSEPSSQTKQWHNGREEVRRTTLQPEMQGVSYEIGASASSQRVFGKDPLTEEQLFSHGFETSAHYHHTTRYDTVSREIQHKAKRHVSFTTAHDGGTDITESILMQQNSGKKNSKSIIPRGCSSQANSRRSKSENIDTYKKRWSTRFIWPEVLHHDFVSATFSVGLERSSPHAVLSALQSADPNVTVDTASTLLRRYKDVARKGQNPKTVFGLGQSQGTTEPSHLASFIDERKSQHVVNQDNNDANALEASSDMTRGFESCVPLDSSTMLSEIGESIFLPRLTDEEKKSSIGISFSYLTGLFASLTQQLESKRQHIGENLDVVKSGTELLHTNTDSYTSNHVGRKAIGFKVSSGDEAESSGTMRQAALQATNALASEYSNTSLRTQTYDSTGSRFAGLDESTCVDATKFSPENYAATGGVRHYAVSNSNQAATTNCYTYMSQLTESEQWTEPYSNYPPGNSFERLPPENVNQQFDGDPATFNTQNFAFNSNMQEQEEEMAYSRARTYSEEVFGGYIVDDQLLDVLNKFQ